MTEKWENKIAVITGSSAGIGASIFKDFVNAGLIVIGLARRVERVEELIETLKNENSKGQGYSYKCDVSNPESVKETFKWIENKFGSINILVNNAGIGRIATILEDGDESMRRINEVLDTNLRGLIHCSKVAFQLMKKSDDYGMIININSILGHRNPFLGADFNVYPATKYAVTAVSETIRHEITASGNRKIRVTSISPGRVRTEIGIASGRAQTLTEEEKEKYSKLPTLYSEDISHSVMHLLSAPYHVNIAELVIQAVCEEA
jgi:NADP+-dependent farnesol dehydrogenase